MWIPPGRAPSWYDPRPTDFWPATPRDPVFIHRGEDVPPALLDAIDAGYTFVAHNATGFDAPAYRHLVGGPQPAWYDTVPCARAAGLPGKLDELGEKLTGQGKDKTGAKVMKMLSVAKDRGTGDFTYNVCTDAAWNLLIRYNVQDVLLLERVFHETKDSGEADVLQVDYRINSRGIAVDLCFADAIRGAWIHAEEEACKEVETLTQGAITRRNIRSVEQVKAWIEEKGVKLDSLDKNAVKRLIDTPEEIVEDSDNANLELIVEVLKLRRIATSAAAGKLASLRGSVRDDRARDMLVYYGAGPGRWSGRGFQPQNLGSGDERVDVEACLAAICEMPGYGDEPGPTTEVIAKVVAEACPGVPLRDALSTLTRPVFFASAECDLIIVDYAAVEARGVAWVAGDEPLLEAYREGRDIYCEMASTVFGRPVAKSDKTERKVGKELVLGAGYSMGANRFARQCKIKGIDLAAIGTSAQACVSAYREMHAPIKQLWRRLGDAAMGVVKGDEQSVTVGPVRVCRDGRHMLILLPSGRPIVYRNARIEDQVPAYCRMLGLPEIPKPTVVYDHPRGYAKGVYGGLLTENVVQGLCRDLLATSLVRCEQEALPVVLHVHDEIVCEVPTATSERDLERLIEIMTDVPPWARGFPVAAEGFVSPRYTKSPFKGYAVRKGESK